MIDTREATLNALVEHLNNKEPAKAFLRHIIHTSNHDVHRIVLPMAVRLIECGYNVDSDQLIRYCHDRLSIVLLLREHSNVRGIDYEIEYLIGMCQCYADLFHNDELNDKARKYCVCTKQ